VRQLIVSTFLTLDGVLQGPGGQDEDADGGRFPYGGWSVRYWDDLMNETQTAAMSRPFDVVLGRRTYDLFAAFWPYAEGEAAKPLNSATKYVASRGRPDLSWDRSVLLEGDAAESVARLKREDGPELQVHGSGNLIQTLMRHNLIDEYRLWVFPVVLGTGKRLFPDGAVPGALDLVDHKVSSTGVTIGTYRPAGEVVTGSFG
jgi:dihydrofolate reductase